MSSKRPAEETEEGQSRRIRYNVDIEHQERFSPSANAVEISTEEITSDGPSQATTGPPQEEARIPRDIARKQSDQGLSPETLQVPSEGQDLNEGLARVQRVSVGPAFQSPPIVDQRLFLATTQKKFRYERPRGISNSGQKCYRNAVLAAFVQSRFVMNYLRYWHVKSRIIGGAARSSKGSILGMLRELMVRLVDNKKEQHKIDKYAIHFWNQFCYEIDSENKLLKAPSNRSWRVYIGDSSGQQDDQPQDAHEFFIWMIGAISDQFKDASSLNSPNLRLDGFEWLTNSRFVPRMKCAKCKFRVQRRVLNSSEPCLILNFVQDSFKKVSLADLIDNALCEEVTTMCSRCKKSSTCTRAVKFQHAPALLTMTLSRALGVTADGTPIKDFTAVVIPEQIDISQHLNIHEFGEGSKITYTLSGVISHQGLAIAEGGHYVSYVRGGRDWDQWFMIDDHRVKSSSKVDFDDSRAMSLNAEDLEGRFTPCILFYERNFDQDVIYPGRPAMNVGEGGSEDEQPTEWTGSVRDVTPVEPEESLSAHEVDGTNGPLTGTGAEVVLESTGSAVDAVDAVDAVEANDEPVEEEREAEEEAEEAGSSDEEASNLPENWVLGAEGEDEFPPAILKVKVTIGDLEIVLPRQVISQFRWTQRRDNIKVDARLRTPRGRLKRLLGKPLAKGYVELDLCKVQHPESHNSSSSNKADSRKLVRKPGSWMKSWHNVDRSSGDLTLEDVKLAQQLYLSKVEEEEEGEKIDEVDLDVGQDGEEEQDRPDSCDGDGLRQDA